MSQASILFVVVSDLERHEEVRFLSFYIHGYYTLRLFFWHLIRLHVGNDAV